jgi:tetratricopeptide (TPR) repeat protein
MEVVKRLRVHVVIIGAVVMLPVALIERLAAQHSPPRPGLRFVQQPTGALLMNSSPVSGPESARLAPITVDYPEEGSIFPPDITAPTVVWRDVAESATTWLIDVAFADDSPGIHVISRGERLRVGEIDPRCMAQSNELPTLKAQEAAARSWTPDADTWAAIKQHSVERPATVTITGFTADKPQQAVSRGRVILQTSKDPVGAPIFYRDVPLMPSELEKGVIKPLPREAIPLIAWRLRNVSEPRSRLLLTGLYSCANCHSFSRDGKTLGMDLDGPQDDKGLYVIAPISSHMSISNQDVISWNSSIDKPVGKTRIGFMSQVSPDGRYVVTTINGAEKDIKGNYYTANFKDYRFLQVFYPTRGILAWHSRATGRILPLPGADDPRYVQTDAVWSPDGKYLVFAKAEARNPYPEGWKPPERANDPDETPIQYDLYRIPFNEGKGGQAEMITGASQNGMSNTFPKVSPDGRWIVFVKCRNGQLMRPDSQLYIIPAEGGQARRMRCNTPLMNSWHSFSPNGRWLVFSSKSRSPYTQMFLTHLDEDGNDSPAILIENSTAANRAVNIPEFVNIPPDGLVKIDVPAAEFFRRFDRAWDLAAKGQHDDAISEWKKALELDPGDAKAHNNLGIEFIREGRFDEAMTELQKALEINSEYGEAHNNLGVTLLQKRRFDEAVTHFQKAVEINPGYAHAYFNLGDAFYSRGQVAEALWQWREGLRLEADTRVLNRTAWVLATSPAPSVRNGREALELAQRAVQSSGGRDPVVLETLSAAYAELGRFREAVQTARGALDLAAQQNRQPLAGDLKAKIALYKAKTPFRETQ